MSKLKVPSPGAGKAALEEFLPAERRCARAARDVQGVFQGPPAGGLGEGAKGPGAPLSALHLSDPPTVQRVPRIPVQGMSINHRHAGQPKCPVPPRGKWGRHQARWVPHRRAGPRPWGVQAVLITTPTLLGAVWALDGVHPALR